MQNGTVATMKNSIEFPQKIKIEPLYDLAMPSFLDMYWKELESGSLKGCWHSCVCCGTICNCEDVETN